MSSVKRIEKVYPLSPMQSGMLFHTLKNEKSRAYFEQNILKIKGEIDTDLFQQCFDLIFARHDILRTVFRVDKVEEPLQFVFKKRNFKLHYEDLTQLEEHKQKAVIHQFTRTDRDRGFDPGRDILMRVALFKTALNEYSLVWSFHHILMDGWCLGIIYKELLLLYRWLKTGKTGNPRLEPVIPYIKYIKWLEKQDHEKGLNYWEKYLQGYDLKARLPRLETYEPVKEKTYKPGQYTLELEENETSGIIETAGKYQATTNAVFQTLWGILLQKYNNSDDVVFGVVVSGRSADVAGIAGMVGLFINTVPLRITTLGQDSFLELLKRVRQHATESRAFEYVSLAAIQSKSLLKGELIQHIMAFQNYPLDEEIKNAGKKQDNSFRIEDIRTFEQTNYNLAVTIAPGPCFRVRFSYNAREYKHSIIENAALHLKQVIKQVLDYSHKPLKEIDILSTKEKHQIIFEFNQTQRDYPEDKKMHTLIEEQVERTVNHVVLAGIDDRHRVNSLAEEHLTYGRLNEEANRLARYLKDRGVQPYEILGFVAEPSLEMVIGILGILKAGGVYLPVDPGYPRERIAYMLADSKSRFLVTTGGLTDKVSIDNCHILPVKSNKNDRLAINNLHLDGSNLAYVIYTSGSTGRPRGVVVGNRSLVNLCYWHNRHFSITKADRAAKIAGFGFDASVWEIFPYLIIGSCLYMVPTGVRADIYRLNSFFETHRITAAFLPTQLCEQFITLKNRWLRLLLTGGDKLNKYAQTSYRLVNNYGPTESTVVTTSFAVVGPSRNIPIGTPISNTRIYILDRYHQLQPPGVPGELCITGDGLATGYLNNPELTMERFINHKSQITDIGVGNKKFLRGSRGQFFQKAPPGSQRQKIYKTGDLAYWLRNGNIVFSGRIDHQVKIRGFRIEPGEIETQLLTHKKIKQTLVLPKKNETGDKYLCAYILPVAGCELRDAELKEHLSTYLPDYMIPSWFIIVKRIPLTPNGKIDRGALPDPEIKIDAGYIEPANEVETKLALIWQEVLGLNRDVGIEDNFFQLGGHSLKAMLLTSKIHKELEIQIPLEELFKRPTIRGLEEYISKAQGIRYDSIIPVEKKEYYLLSSAQKRLYFLQQMVLTGTSYNMPMVLSLRKNIEIGKLELALKKLIARHESLRTSFEKRQESPVQIIHQVAEINFSLDYFEADGAEALETIKKYIRPFDLWHAPLIRSGVIRLPGNDIIWMVDTHHIISDGTSHAIMMEDFFSLYAGKELEPLRLQYKDFSQWQNRLFADGGIKSQEDYWHSLYADSREVPRLNLPLDFKRPEVFTFAGDRYDIMLESEDSSEFSALGARNGATLYMNMLAALDTLFYKYTGQTDIIIGSGIAGRPHADLQSIVGMFVNTLAMRNYPAGDKNYESFLKEIVSSSIKAFENQNLQFEEFVDQLALVRDPSRNPLFDITMVVQNFKQPGKIDWENKNSSTPGFRNFTSKFDMTFFIYEVEENIYLSIEYYTAVFTLPTIQRLASHLENIIKAVIASPCIQLKDIEMISMQEKHQVLYEFNSTAQAFDLDKPIHRLFEEQVEKTPDNIAVVGESAQLIASASRKYLLHVTYKQLNENSNRLTRYLSLGKGIKPGDPVAILLSPLIDRPISIMGILKAGGVYVPIDPTAPLERIKYMMADAAVSTVISEKKFLEELNRLQWECKCLHTYLCLDSFAVHREEEPGKNELMDEDLWRHVGENAVDDITGGGWASSYTGEPFTRQEMDEYSDNILKKLQPLLHPGMRVLEIGCASGISMFRIAPQVGFYYGTDLSRVIIEKNQEQVEKEGHHNIKLACLAAHEVQKLEKEEKPFDLVIINSVIQCFHGHNYLRKVIRTALDILGEKGYLFIGDVMDQDKKKVLINDLAAFKNAHRNSDKAYTTKTDFSSELFIAREFFIDLQVDMEEIEDIEFTKKIYTIENELTEFRYDVLFSINKQSVAQDRKAKAKYQDDLHVLSGFETDSFHLPIPSDSPAYIIYTSGTTGQPRGVVIEHRSLVNLCCWHNRVYQVSAADNATLYAGFAFDASVWELFPYLIKGASIHIVDDTIKLDIEALNDYYEQNHITIGFLPTQMCEHFMEKDNKSLRVLLTGGDKLRQFVKKSYRLYNNYGPTENTVVTTYYPVEYSPDNIPIGKPIDNCEIYILQKESFLPQPIGIPGELCISGTNLSRGYLNYPELTNEKFCLRRPGALFIKTAPGPRKNFLLNNQKLLRKMAGSGGETTRFLEKSPPGRRRHKIYKTGDLARWLQGGFIEFLGRMDFQVKIRGFRIELGEIENRLLQHDLVREAVVIDHTDENSDTFLCAYIIPLEPFDMSELKEFLLQRIQDYMIPNYFIRLDRIPLTSSGKVNRKALPAPGFEPDKDYIGPGNEIERKCAKIWVEILNIDKEKISIEANFFELGGHSLKATILASKIHKEFNVKIPLAEVFKNPTIRGISRYIKDADRDEYIPVKPIEKKGYYELSHAQKRLWILDRMQKGQTAYNIPGYQEFTGLNIDAFEKAIQTLVKRHEILRTTFITIKGDPKQKVHHYETLDFKYKYLDLRGKENRNQIVIKLKEEERTTSFDLERGPLLRVKLIHIEEDRHLMLFTMHHIISDGWSMNILAMEFLALYDSYRSQNNDGKPLTPLGIQYKDYTRWHMNQLSGENLEKHQTYWWNQFKGKIPALDLHTDYPRAKLRTFAGEYLSFSLNKEASQQLKQISIRHDSSVFITFLAITNVFFFKYTLRHDIVVGTPAAGRVHRDLENQIGFYVNMLALRNKLNQDQSFLDVLHMVKQNTTAALEHQVYPFDQLVEDLNIKRDSSRNPLYDVVVTAVTKSEQPGNTRDIPENESGSGKHDLRLKINGFGQQAIIEIQYNPGLFKKERIIIIKELLINLITDIFANSNEKIGNLNLMAEFEKKLTGKKFQGGF